jgi:hypothetical protein
MIIELLITCILVIGFGLFDHFSSVYAFKLYNKKLKNYYEYESFEVNPVQKRYVEKGKYNFKHLIGLLMICGLLVISYYSGTNEFKFFQGFGLSIFGYIVSRNIRKLIIYHYFNKNSKALIGKVKETYRYTLDRMVAEAIGLIIFLLILFIFIPSYFTFGVLCGPFFFIFCSLNWKKKYMKKQ